MFSHAFDFAFSVNSERAEASDVAPAVLRAALIRRAAALSDEELAGSLRPLRHGRGSRGRLTAPGALSGPQAACGGRVRGGKGFS